MKSKLKDIEKFRPVEINIKEKRQFAQLAFLLDNLELLNELKAIRKEFHLSKELLANNYFEKATDDELSKLRIFDLNVKVGNLSAEEISTRTKFFKRVALLRHKYEYPPQFDDAIIQAILFNKVNSLKSTLVALYMSNLKNQSLEMAIVITPISTKKEVLDAFSNATKMMQDYKKHHPISVGIKMRKGYLEEIQRDRDWYWRNLHNESPHQIAINDNGGNIKYAGIKEKMKFAGDLSESERNQNERYFLMIDNYAEMVRKAVDRYKDNLSTE